MQIIDITDKNISEYGSEIKKVFGPDIADDLDRIYYHGMIATDEERIAGALAYELIDSESNADTKSIIRFINGEDDEIVRSLFDYYKLNAVPGEGIMRSGYEFADESVADTLKSEGFSKEMRESATLVTTLGEIKKLGIAKQRKIPSYIQSINELSIAEFRGAIRKVVFRGRSGLLEDMPYLPKLWYDGEVSSCSVSDGEVDGFFLIRKTPSGTLIPVLFYAYGPQYTKNLVFLMVNSVLRAIEIYPDDTKVAIIRKNKNTRDLAQKVMPGAKGDNVYTGVRTE